MYFLFLKWGVGLVCEREVTQKEIKKRREKIVKKLGFL